VAGGTIENVRRLQSAEIDFGMTDSHIYSWYQIPSANWPEKYENVRMICPTHHGGFPFVTLESSGIKTFKDLAGKRVSFGPAGTGNHVLATVALEALGIMDEIKVSHHPWAEGGSALADGYVDAFLTSSLPISYIEEVALNRDITWVGISPEEEAILAEKCPYISIETIPSGMHGVEKSVRALAVTSWWATHKDVPYEAVDIIMRKFFTEEGLEAGGNVTDVWKNWTYEGALDSLPRKLHPAAEAFWKEKGLVIPEVPEVEYKYRNGKCSTVKHSTM